MKKVLFLILFLNVFLLGSGQVSQLVDTKKLIARDSIRLGDVWRSTWPSGGGGGGTLTTISVATANGLGGTVANPTTTPVITLSTPVNGMVKANGTAFSAAVAGVDYLTPGTSLALNGLYKSSNTIKLGGPLIEATTVTLGSNDLVIHHTAGNSFFTPTQYAFLQGEADTAGYFSSLGGQSRFVDLSMYHMRDDAKVTRNAISTVNISLTQARIGWGLGVSSHIDSIPPADLPTSTYVSAADSVVTIKAAHVNVNGTTNTNNDVEITDPTKGIILRTAGGDRIRITVVDTGGGVFTIQLNVI